MAPKQKGRFANILVRRSVYLALNELKHELRLNSQGETIRHLIDNFKADGQHDQS